VRWVVVERKLEDGNVVSGAHCWRYELVPADYLLFRRSHSAARKKSFKIHDFVSSCNGKMFIK